MAPRPRAAAAASAAVSLWLDDNGTVDDESDDIGPFIDRHRVDW